MAAGWTASASRSSRFARRRDFLCDHTERAGIVAETHPLSLGVLGIFGDGRADEYLFDTPCDLLIAVGVSFGGLVTRSFSPRWRGLKADVVHVDPDPSAVGRFVATSLGITTSGRAFVNALNCGRPPRFVGGWACGRRRQRRCRGPRKRGGIDSPA